MDQVIAEYLAEKLLDDVRSGHLPSTELSRAVCRFPIIDYLRKLIKSNDWHNLRSLCESHDEDMRTLGLALLKNILYLNDVRRYLEEMWNRPDLTFKDRIGVQYTLLNYDNLDLSLHKQLFDFTLKNWEHWLTEGVSRWAGGRQAVLEYCNQRLSDGRLPKMKRWVYICGAAAADNQTAARHLIEGSAENSDPFLRDVVHEALSRLELQN